MDKKLQDILITIAIVLIIINFAGYLWGFLDNSCDYQRMVNDNWITGLGYKLSCYR